MNQYDVVVVGAGPAGSSCAKALTEAGVSVLVVEKERLPRYKCCSGVLFGRGQETVRSIFGTDPPKEVLCAQHSIIHADDCFDWDEQRGYTPHVWELDWFGQPHARTYLNVWRDRFDYWLLEQSAAQYRDRTRVEGFAIDGEQIVVTVRPSTGEGSGGPNRYSCKYLVGADGTLSAVRRQLEQTGPGREHGLAGTCLQSYFRWESLGKLRKDGWISFFLPEISDILCAVHQKDDYLLLMLGAYQGRRSLRQSMEEFKTFLADKLYVRLGAKWRDEGCRMDRRPPFAGAGRILLVGEAGGLHCLSCGMADAMDSGYCCGKAVAGALHDGTNAIESYAESIKDHIAHSHRSKAEIHFYATPPPTH